MRRLLLGALVLAACGTSSSRPSSPVTDGGADAGLEAGAEPDPGGYEEPLPECISTSIGIWDDFEEPLDGTSAQFAPAGTTAIGFDPLHHCGAQGIRATVAGGGTTALFVRAVPPPGGAATTTAVSWSFLVSFEPSSSESTFRFAELLLANQRRLVFELVKGSLSLVEKDDLAVDAGAAENVHPNLATLAPNEWQRIDMRLEYATKKATLKIGPPGGTAPTQEQTLVFDLDRVTTEQLGPTAPEAGSVTVHYDRAAVFVE